ncbi:MAG: HAD family hydrolase [Bacillaceae bacterium]|nr:HAD family hydrolase [Bacillaceae bacterium]
MITTVIFDLDETLTDHEKTEKNTLKNFFQGLDGTGGMSFEQFTRLWNRTSDRLLQDYFDGKISLEQRRILRMQEVFENWGEILSDEEARHYHQVFVHQYLENVAVFPDVLDCLKSLSDYKLGIVSNGEADIQRSKLKGAGIDHFFSAIVISGDLNISKPDSRIFQACLKELNARPEQAVYIGDHIEKDVGGAVNTGMYGILIDRQNKQIENKFPNMTVIQNLNELKHALRNVDSNLSQM